MTTAEAVTAFMAAARALVDAAEAEGKAFAKRIGEEGRPSTDYGRLTLQRAITAAVAGEQDQRVARALYGLITVPDERRRGPV
jgi:hypothetical protein